MGPHALALGGRVAPRELPDDAAQPKLLFGIAALLVLRRVLPAPGPIFRALARGRALRKQLALNPKNALAARDLATLELDLLRPRAALGWIELGLST